MHTIGWTTFFASPVKVAVSIDTLAEFDSSAASAAPPAPRIGDAICCGEARAVVVKCTATAPCNPDSVGWVPVLSMPAIHGLLKRERSVHAAAWNTGTVLTVAAARDVGLHSTAVRLRNNMPTVGAFGAGP